MNCPHCDKPIVAKVLAKLAQETEICEVVTIAPGHMLAAKTVGGMLTNFAKLLEAVGKELGEETFVFVKEISLKKQELKIRFVLAGRGRDVTQATMDMIRELSQEAKEAESEPRGAEGEG